MLEPLEAFVDLYESAPNYVACRISLGGDRALQMAARGALWAGGDDETDPVAHRQASSNETEPVRLRGALPNERFVHRDPHHPLPDGGSSTTYTIVTEAVAAEEARARGRRKSWSGGARAAPKKTHAPQLPD